MLSIPSSPRLELENMSQEPSSSISSQQSLTKSELEPTDNYSILNSSSPERRMLPTTSPEVTTPLVKRSSISVLTELESLLTSAQDSKDSSSSTLLEEELDQDSGLFSSRDFQSIMARNPSSDSPSTHHLRYPLQLSSHTTQSSQLTPSWSTLMLPLCLITKPSMTLPEETSILRDQPTLTSTDSSLRLSHP